MDTHGSSDEFHDVVWVEFTTTMQARKVKQMMDDKPFFTNILRVSYAPEYESVDDFRNKLQERYKSKLAAWQPRRRKNKLESKKDRQQQQNVIDTTVKQEEEQNHGSQIGPIQLPMNKNNSTLSRTTTTTTVIYSNHSAQHKEVVAKKKRRRI